MNDVVKKTVCVDLDGVLAKYDGWKGVYHIGEPIKGAREFLQALRDRNYTIVIHTTRASATVNRGFHRGNLHRRIEVSLQENEMPYHSIWTGDGKPLAIAYVDDRAVFCAPQLNKHAFGNALLFISCRDVNADLEKKDQ